MVKSSVIFSPAGVEIITKPYLVGKELEVLSQRSSEDFVRSLDGAAEYSNPVSLEILNGGHYYFVGPAYEAVTGKPCGIATLHAKRRFDDGEWKVRVWDQAGAAIADADVLLVGDTVATGTTLAGVLNECVNAMDAAGKHCDIKIFCIAGSAACEHHLEAVQKRLEPHGKSVTICYANAKFNLAANGTDLGFDGADFNEDAKSAVETAVGAFASKMKCAVWDWGDRFREIKNHLTEILEYFESVDDTAEEFLNNIKTRLAKATAAAAAAESDGATATATSDVAAAAPAPATAEDESKA